MEIELERNYFKLIFLAGLSLITISVFLDWYHIRAIDNVGKLKGEWKFNVFAGFYTTIQEKDVFNSLIRPEDISFPYYLGYFYVCLTITSAYSVYFGDFKRLKKIENAKYYFLVLTSLVLLNFYYSIMFPVILILNGHYYPYLIITEESVSFINVVGMGYVMHAISFILIFPYVAYYFFITKRFKLHDIRKDSKSQEINHLDEINWRELIGQEQVKLSLEKNVKNLFEG